MLLKLVWSNSATAALPQHCQIHTFLCLEFNCCHRARYPEGSVFSFPLLNSLAACSSSYFTTVGSLVSTNWLCVCVGMCLRKVLITKRPISKASLGRKQLLLSPKTVPDQTGHDQLGSLTAGTVISMTAWADVPVKRWKILRVLVWSHLHTPVVTIFSEFPLPVITSCKKQITAYKQVLGENRQSIGVQ